MGQYVRMRLGVSVPVVIDTGTPAVLARPWLVTPAPVIGIGAHAWYWCTCSQREYIGITVIRVCTRHEEVQQ